MMAGRFRRGREAAFTEGEAALAQVRRPAYSGPIQPMLAQTAEDASEAITRIWERRPWSTSWTERGFRCIGRETRFVFIRAQLNDVTGAVPEIVEAVRALPVKELILDGEVLSSEVRTVAPSRSKSRCAASAASWMWSRLRAEQPITPFWFDLLYLNGGSLLDESQSRRFSTLRDLAGESSVVAEHDGPRRRRPRKLS